MMSNNDTKYGYRYECFDCGAEPVLRYRRDECPICGADDGFFLMN